MSRPEVLTGEEVGDVSFFYQLLDDSGKVIGSLIFDKRGSLDEFKNRGTMFDTCRVHIAKHDGINGATDLRGSFAPVFNGRNLTMEEMKIIGATYAPTEV